MTDKAMIISEEQASPIAAFLAEPERLNALDVDKVEQLFKLHERWVEREAQREYAAAFNKVQSEITPVAKRGKAEHSMYARAQDIARMLDPILIANGFSWSISTRSADDPNLIRFVLKVRHVTGHSEEHTMDAPADTHGPKGGAVKSQLHGRASSYTYCSRYLRANVFGLQLGDDDDGNAGAGVEKPDLVSADDVASLNALADKAGADKAGACQFYAIASFAQMTLKDAKQFRGAMTKRIANQAAAAEGVNEVLAAVGAHPEPVQTPAAGASPVIGDHARAK